MKGLEISEKFLSETSHELDDVFRIDAEHYQHHYQINDAILRKHQFNFLRNLVMTPVVTGHTPSMKVDGFYYGDISFIKTDNLRENKIIKEFNHYLSQEGAEQLKGSALSASDIITTIIGATYSIVGRTAILQDEDLPANINQNIARIRPNQKKISPHYLNIFLNSKHGRLALHYHSRQTEQVNLNCREVERVIVPLFPFLPSKIEVLVFSALDYARKSSITYTQAETLLLNALGVADFSPSTKSVNIKSFTESFAATGRLDAEYYQPKYEEMVNRISAQPHARLTDLVTIQKSIEPGSDAYTDDDGLPFLRVADYDKLGISTPQKRLNSIFSNEHFEKLEALKPKKGTILFSKDGSVGEAFCLREDADFITSGAILHLSIRNKQKILPEYLTLALNSILVRTQAERDAGGSIILHWRVDEIKNVLIPLVDITTQQKISSLVQKSFSFKSESERLLEVAKRAVEIAIEQDEAAGLAYIQEQTTIQDVLAAEVHESCYSCQRIEED